MTKSIVILLFLSITISIACKAQVVEVEKDFTYKNILSKIFKGEFQEELNVQKWPVSGVQALELNSSYVDFTQNAYTIVDTILIFQFDTSSLWVFYSTKINPCFLFFNLKFIL